MRQVSPPQEDVRGDQWWTRYQPVSYKIYSRSGDRAMFQDMVRRCRAVGVDIVVDGVLNHMANGGPGTSRLLLAPFPFHHGSTGTSGLRVGRPPCLSIAQRVEQVCWPPYLWHKELNVSLVCCLRRLKLRVLAFLWRLTDVEDSVNQEREK